MVRENRIKEEKFSYGPIAADAVGQTISSLSGMACNGQIVEVVSSFNQNGSLALVESGLSTRTIWRLNASSGTNPIYCYPTTLAQAPTGSAAGYGGTMLFPINGPLLLTTGSLTSGTAATLSVTVRYI